MSRALSSALGWLGEQHAPLERALEELVAQPSFTLDRDGGQRVGDLLCALFALPGVDARRTPSSSGAYADHLVFSTRAEGPPTLLIGHLDTVFPPGTFEGFRRDGELRRGPGVLDMKGGLVVVAFALSALAREGQLERLPLRVIVVSDEEVGSPEGRLVIEREARGAAASLVFEAGRQGDAIITRRRGTGNATALARGRRAHAGNAHHEGANAVWALARFVDRAQKLTDHARGVTVNVGVFRGGETRNTVPDEAEAQLDLRFETVEAGRALLSSLDEIAAEVARSLPGTSVEVRSTIGRAPLEATEASLALANAYGEAARREGLGSGLARLIGGGSDACTTGALGVASIDGLGPRGRGFHTHDEQIEAATLVPKARALARFLLAGGRAGSNDGVGALVEAG